MIGQNGEILAQIVKLNRVRKVRLAIVLLIIRLKSSHYGGNIVAAATRSSGYTYENQAKRSVATRFSATAKVFAY